MATPNILDPTTIIGKSVGQAIGTGTTTNLLANAASSGKLLKITSIYVSNVDGTNAVNVTLWHNIGGTQFKVVQDKPIAAGEGHVLVERSAPLYIEEDDEIGLYASAALDAEVVCYYEEIS